MTTRNVPDDVGRAIAGLERRVYELERRLLRSGPPSSCVPFAYCDTTEVDLWGYGDSSVEQEVLSFSYNAPGDGVVLIWAQALFIALVETPNSIWEVWSYLYHDGSVVGTDGDSVQFDHPPTDDFTMYETTISAHAAISAVSVGSHTVSLGAMPAWDSVDPSPWIGVYDRHITVLWCPTGEITDCDYGG